MDNSCNNSIFNNWGKSYPNEDGEPSYHLLVYHCLDVAAVGNVLLEKDDLLIQKFIHATGLSKEQTLSFISFFLALHDLGKFSERFQYLNRELFKKLSGRQSAKGYNMRHDSMGFLLWYEIWLEVWGQNWLGLDSSADKYDWQDILIPWIQAVTGHHGRPPSLEIHGVDVNPQTQFTKEDVEMASIFVKEIAGMFLKPGTGFNFKWDEDLETKFIRSSWLLAGLVILSDWIGSNREYFHPCSETMFFKKPMPLKKYWETQALPSAESAIQRAGVLPSEISQDTGMETLFPDFKKTLSPLQDYVSRCEIADTPQLFIIEESTGSGKTEAALTLAHRFMAKGLAEGIFIALPTMATATAMYERAVKAYKKLFCTEEKPSLILAHSGSYFSDQFRHSIGLEEAGFISEYRGKYEETASAQCAAWLADNRKKALLADVGVGTIDQILMAVLPTNHQSLRILGMSTKVLIIDEVHAYDPYMNALLCRLLSFHSALGGSTILLSATLPAKQRQELANNFCKGRGVKCSKLNETAYPLITSININEVSEIPVEARMGTSRKVEIEFFEDNSQVKAKIRDVADKGGCVCWIRNTVGDAVEAYEEISSEIGTGKVLLFHARFAMGDRLEIEQNVLHRFGKVSTPEIRGGYILIATQVVEQSLDLDFDYMVSDLAPMDLMIQRAGRIHRHQRDRIGSCIPTLGILAPKLTEKPSVNWYSDVFPKAAYVYPSHGQLWLTARQLAKSGEFTMPDDARKLIECVFGSGSRTEIPETLRDRDDRAEAEGKAAISIAGLNALSLDDGYKITSSHWVDDAITPTRIGELTTTVRLACWDGKTVTPWKEGKFSWQLSQVNIDQRKIKAEDEFSTELKAAVEEAKKSMPDKGKWSVLVPLSSTYGGEWQGYARDATGNRVQVTYNPRTGLIVSN